MITSAIFFGKNYTKWQYTGCALILTGVCVAYAIKDDFSFSGLSKVDPSVRNFNFIYFCAILPIVASNLYKEKALTDDTIDDFELNTRIGVW